MEPIDCVIEARGRRQAFSLTKLASLMLATYWLLLMIGTHVPSSANGSPLIWDKLLHFAAYAGLASLLALVVKSRYDMNLSRYTAIFLIAGVYGAIDELAQLPIPGRNADFRDWLANLLGAVSGLIFFRLVAMLFASHFTRRNSRRRGAGSSDFGGRAPDSACPAPHKRPRTAKCVRS